MFAHGSRSRDDRGETLVEILAAVIILGITGVAVLTGLMLAVKSSDIHRKGTTSSAYARSFAEAIEDYVSAASGNYKKCAAEDAYKVTSVMKRLTDLSVASGAEGEFFITQDKAMKVDGGGVASECNSAGEDTGLQQITIRVRSRDDRGSEILVILVRQPCTKDASC